MEIFTIFYLAVALGVLIKSETLDFGSKLENKIAPWICAIIWPIILGMKIASFDEDPLRSKK